jgi:hypothetical protein
MAHLRTFRDVQPLDALTDDLQDDLLVLPTHGDIDRTRICFNTDIGVPIQSTPTDATRTLVHLTPFTGLQIPQPQLGACWRDGAEGNVGVGPRPLAAPFLTTGGAKAAAAFFDVLATRTDFASVTWGCGSGDRSSWVKGGPSSVTVMDGALVSSR